MTDHPSITPSAPSVAIGCDGRYLTHDERITVLSGMDIGPAAKAERRNRGETPEVERERAKARDKAKRENRLRKLLDADPATVHYDAPAPNDPTPEEIAAGCRAIRSGWNKWERSRRAVTKVERYSIPFVRLWGPDR